jgi:hypothetical protein
MMLMFAHHDCETQRLRDPHRLTATISGPRTAVRPADDVRQQPLLVFLLVIFLVFLLEFHHVQDINSTLDFHK